MPYKNLIVAAFGSIGYGFLKRGRKYFSAFREVIVLDRDPARLAWGQKKFRNHRFLQVNVADPNQVTPLLFSLKDRESIFMNLCSYVDTVVLRRLIAPFPCAYVDASCSEIAKNPAEVRFSKLMPYTLQTTHKNHPHFICQGINPGLVELSVRMLLQNFPAQNKISLVIYEKDDLSAENQILAGWSPSLLVEEMLIAPPFYFHGGELKETPDQRPVLFRFSWKGETLSAFRVGHEDTWNFGHFDLAAFTCFYYSLHPELMLLLAKGDPDQVLKQLRVPHAEDRIAGSDAITISLISLLSGEQTTVTWETSHAWAKEAHGLNAVQYQTATGLLFIVLLLCALQPSIAPGTYTLSDFPLTPAIHTKSLELFRELKILWQPDQDLPVAQFP